MSKNIFKHFTLLGFDRSFSKGLISQLAWLAGIMCVVYIVLTGISYVGEMYARSESGSNRLLDILLVLIDPGSGSESMSSTLTIVCAILGLIFFSGMLISVISNVLERRVDRYTKGETDYKVSNHYVIIGLNKTIPSLLRSLYKKSKKSYIILMSEQNSESVRDWLHSNINEEIENNLIVLNGVRNAKDDIKRLRLDKNVKEIYVIGEENEPAHDAINMECVNMLVGILPTPKAGKKVRCHVQFDSNTMYSVLQSVDIDKKIKDKVSFHPFNFNEVWAQKILATIPSAELSINEEKQDWNYISLDGKGITRDSNMHVHLVLVGMNEMSYSIATNAAHILHFPNYAEGDFNTCSKITFIDPNAKELGKLFRSRYETLFDLACWRSVEKTECTDNSSWIDPIGDKQHNSKYKGILGDTNFMDIQWEFIEGNVNDIEVINYLSEHADDKRNEILTLIFCDKDSESNARSCLGMPDNVIAKVYQILVRQQESSLLVNMLRKSKKEGYCNIRPFGFDSVCLYNNSLHEEFGIIVAASYDNTLGNEAIMRQEWEEKSVAIKWSNMYCANMLYTKLRFLGLDPSLNLKIEDINNALAAHEDDIQKTEHNRWNTEKLLMGYRPLQNDEERETWLSSPETKKLMKEQLKHLDILSNKLLKEIDPAAINYDISVNKEISNLYLIAKKIKEEYYEQ